MITPLMMASAVLAYFIKGMTGFANTLVFSTILSFTTSNLNISPLELLVSSPSNLLIAYQNRKNLDAKVWLPLSALVILGCIPGAFFLKLGNVGTIKILFGFVILVVALEMFLRELKPGKMKPNKWILLLLGLVSGALCGLFGIGALLAAYVGRTTENAGEFKGNLCIVFSVENTFRLILYLATGIITREIALQALILVPFMAAGLAIGLFCAKRVPEKAVKRMIVLLLFFSGVSLILTNLGIF